MPVFPTMAHRFGATFITVAALVFFAGCTATPAGPTAPPSSLPSTPPASPGDVKLPIAITLTGDQVSPSGRKLDVEVGTVIGLEVTSDHDDEIHAHTGGDEYELEVKANTPTSGSFTVTTPGSFDVESHHLGKVIVILNVR